MLIAFLAILFVTFIFAVLYIISMLDIKIRPLPKFQFIPLRKRKTAAVVTREQEARKPTYPDMEELSMEIEDLQWLLEKKKKDLAGIQQQQELSKEAAMKLETLSQQLEMLETRLASAEKKMVNTSTLSLELDDTQSALSGVEQQAISLQESLSRSLNEKEMLRHRLEDAEVEIASLQQQNKQMFKRLKMLESLNKELTDMADHIKHNPGGHNIVEFRSSLDSLQHEKDHVRSFWK